MLPVGLGEGTEAPLTFVQFQLGYRLSFRIDSGSAP